MATACTDFQRPYVLHRKDRTKLFERTIDHLALYAGTQFKNGSDMVVCIGSEECIGPEEPVTPDNLTNNNKCVWDYKMNNLLRTKQNLKGNLQNL